MPAFTTGYYPVLTGQLLCVVYDGTSGCVPMTSQSQVSVISCNFTIPGFITQETLDITFNSSNGPVVPSIDDLVQVESLTSVSGNPVTILTHMILPAQYVITGIEINASNLFLDGTTPPFNMSIHLDQFSPYQSMRQFVIAMRPDFENSRLFSFCDETGLNIPANGLQVGALNLNFGGYATLPSWASITASITYSLVTL